MNVETILDRDTSVGAGRGLPDTDTLSREAPRVLRRLAEPGAVLAVAEGLEKAVVVRETPSGTVARLAVVDNSVAQAMALQGWIAGEARGKVLRYRLTAAGRTEMNRTLRDGPGFAEASHPFDHAAPVGDEAPRGRIRYSRPDSPVVGLARRRGTDGKPFLEDALVRVAERIAEDFELAQMEPRLSANWDQYLTGPIDGGPRRGARPRGADGARQRVAEALRVLGPGLGDVVLRCCCFQQGIEQVEKKLGWSARSGKIVLRIALQRLRRHYETRDPGADLIG